MKKVTSLQLQAETSLGCCGPVVQPQLSDEGAQQAAELFKALADPARLQILDVLSQHAGDVCACDFEGMVGLPDAATGQRPKQPTISHHLKVLRAAGLVESEKRGLWVYYFIRPERLPIVKTVLALLTSNQAAAQEPRNNSANPCCG
jgi:ArsR family transcriptional regulator